MTSIDKLTKKAVNTRKYATMYFDVMEKGQFLYQFKYLYCPIFRINLNDVLEKLFEVRPSFQGRNIELVQTDDVLF